MPLAETELRSWSRWHSGATVALAACLVAPVATIPRAIPLTYNEGWNAYFAARAMAPALGPLYPAADGLISNNYPPLSFYLIGAAGRLTGDPIVAGRVVALVALLASGALVAVIVRQLGGKSVWATAAGLLLVSYIVVLAPQYVATNDPQWLAHAVMLAGIAVLLASLKAVRRWRGIAVGAALVVAALFIKHNLLALPAAATLWLAATDRRAALVWCVAGAVATAAAGGVAYALFGDALVDSVVHHGRVYDVTRVLHSSWATALLMPLFAVALTLQWRSGSALPLLFVAIALPFGMIQRGGEGVSYNAQFEGLIALSIAAGLALSAAAEAPVTLGRRRLGAGTLLGITLLPLALDIGPYAVSSANALATLDTRTASWRQIEARIAATPGPVACELLAACFWGGKDFAWDFFNEGQRLRLGAPLAPLANRIAGRDFGAIVLTRGPVFAARDDERLPQPLPRLIDAAYAPVATGPDDTAFLAPRTRSAAP